MSSARPTRIGGVRVDKSTEIRFVSANVFVAVAQPGGKHEAADREAGQMGRIEY